MKSKNTRNVLLSTKLVILSIAMMSCQGATRSNVKPSENVVQEVPPSPCLCEYGEYVMVDSDFSHKFWPQLGEMGYAYHQRNFPTFAAMLDWSATNNVDWGWKEGSKYGQLFYQQTDKAHSVSLLAKLLSTECWDFDSNDFDARMSFIKKSVLMNHPSFAYSAARVAYVQCTEAGSASPNPK